MKIAEDAGEIDDRANIRAVKSTSGEWSGADRTDQVGVWTRGERRHDRLAVPIIQNDVIGVSRQTGTLLFDGLVEEEVEIGPFAGIRPSLGAWARVIGHNTIFVDDRDPLCRGFQIG